jgi:hypothetical protein
VVAVLWIPEPRMSTCFAAIWNLAVSCCEPLSSPSPRSPASPHLILHVDDAVIGGTDREVLELRASLQGHFQLPLHSPFESWESDEPPPLVGESSEDQKSDSSSEPAWAGLGFPGRAQNSRSSGGTGECPPGDLAA